MNSTVNMGREPAEPRAETAKLPPWLLLFALALLSWGAQFFIRNSGSFDPRVYLPYTSAKELAQAQPPHVESPLDKGRQLYASTCALCHQSNGLGDPTKAPPLAGSEWVQTPSAARIIRIVLDGMSGPMTVKGEAWNLSMPPWKDNFNDQQIAAVLTYVRNAWGNQAPPVAPEQVRNVREEDKDRSSPWTAEELLTTPEK